MAETEKACVVCAALAENEPGVALCYACTRLIVDKLRYDFGGHLDRWNDALAAVLAGRSDPADDAERGKPASKSAHVRRLREQPCPSSPRLS